VALFKTVSSNLYRRALEPPDWLITSGRTAQLAMTRGINRLSIDDIDQTKVTWNKTTVDLFIYVDPHIRAAPST